MTFFRNTDKGFTLIELMTALSIFAVVMTISMGSILGIFDANRKSRSLKSVMSNLNIAIESMSRDIRFGTNYHCGSSGAVTSPQDCTSGGTFISFSSSSDEQVTYRLSGTSLERRVDTGDFVAMTAPEVFIDSLTFYVYGTGTGNLLQPRAFISLKAHAGTGRGRSDLVIQTLMTQRALDI